MYLNEDNEDAILLSLQKSRLSNTRETHVNNKHNQAPVNNMRNLRTCKSREDCLTAFRNYNKEICIEKEYEI